MDCMSYNTLQLLRFQDSNEGVSTLDACGMHAEDYWPRPSTCSACATIFRARSSLAFESSRFAHAVLKANCAFRHTMSRGCAAFIFPANMEIGARHRKIGLTGLAPVTRKEAITCSCDLDSSLILTRQ